MDLLMHWFLRYRHWAFVAAILWLTVGLCGAHSHICFDGQEPPISIHLALDADGEIHHPDEDLHQDVDVQLSQLTPVKLLKIDLPLLLTAVIIILSLLLVCIPGFIYTTPLRSLPSRILPPLRAPPVPVVIA